MIVLHKIRTCKTSEIDPITNSVIASPRAIALEVVDKAWVWMKVPKRNRTLVSGSFNGEQLMMKD